MISVERVLEYNNLKSEASLSVPKHKPPKDWPQRGEVLFQDVELKYGSSDVPVLKNINFRINAGEKVNRCKILPEWFLFQSTSFPALIQIGIVGRTGAGKSSIIEALFRLTEPSGSIIIDGILVSEIGLHDLRGRMSVIPQVRDLS